MRIWELPFAKIQFQWMTYGKMSGYFSYGQNIVAKENQRRHSYSFRIPETASSPVITKNIC